MSNQIHELPAETEAGLEFDYSTWTDNTEVTLCNVPWDNTNRDILSPAFLDGMDAYIDNLSGNDVYPNMVPLRVSEPISIPKPYNVAARYNYLRAVHKAKPVQGGDIPTTYYYFITGFVEDSPNSTRIILQLDVWATYGKSVKIKSAFVERSHIGIANENRMRNNGRDFLSIPEGLDIGSGYVTRWSAGYSMYQLSNAAVLVCSNVALEQPWFDGGGKPIKKASRGGTFSAMASGATFYVFQNATQFRIFMEAVTNAPHIAQGIMSVTLIPEFSQFWPSYTWDTWPDLNVAPTGAPQKYTQSFFSDWRGRMRGAIPARYRHLDKFLTYPYTVCELTSYTGSPLHLRPEYWNSDDVTVEIMAGLVPPNQRVVIMPSKYGGNAASVQLSTDYLDSALVLSNFPTLPMVNDGGALYMAQNAHGIAQQMESAAWTRDKSARSAQTSYDQASRSIAGSSDMVNQNIRTQRAQQGINERYAWADAAFSGIGQIGQGAAGGAVAGPAGAGVGATMGTISAGLNAAGTAMGIAKQGEQLAVNISDQRAQQDISTGVASFMRDSNADLASYAATGDYNTTIAGIMAQAQDAKISPNSVIGSFGGEAFNLINNIPTVVWRGKMIDDATIRKIGDYWLRYGYAVEMYIDMPESLMAMSRFTYWKLTETYINAAPMPELFKQAIRGIFEKGVTVWNHPDMIGSFSNNEPLAGIAL